MVTKKFRFIALLLIGGMNCASLYAMDYPEKIVGFIGTYHSNSGHVYAGENVAESTFVQDAFAYGTYGIVNCPGYSGFPFDSMVKLCCETWKVNKVYGVILCPTEGGVVNNPADTLLWQIASSNYGMIQAGHRFSELSKIYPQIEGFVLDDYWNNYNYGMDSSDMRDVKDALLGKYVDKNGVVHHDSTATTPNLKFFICVYEWGLWAPDATTKDIVDGVSFWIWNQNSSYASFSAYINTVRTRYPHKDIIPGVYILHGNGSGGLLHMTPTSINYMTEKSMDLYDDGYIRGIFVFSGDWVVMEYITRPRWDSLAIPHEYNNVYFPYLGKGTGTAYESVSGNPLEDVRVSCFTAGRVVHDTFYVTRQMTDSVGVYGFGAWAGNRTTDSTYYWIIGEKSGYLSDTVSGWIKRQQLTTFPDLILTLSGIDEISTVPRVSLSVKPNPSASKVILQYSLYSKAYLTLKIYDLMGREVKSIIKGMVGSGIYNTEWNGRYENGKQAEAGVYFCRLDAGAGYTTRKITLLK